MSQLENEKKSIDLNVKKMVYRLYTRLYSIVYENPNHVMLNKKKYTLSIMSECD